MADETQMNALLDKLKSKEGIQLNSSSISTLFTSFVPSASPHVRSLGFLILSRIITNARPNQKQATQELQDKATHNLVRLFAPPVQARLSATTDQDILSATGFLVALFQVDSSTAADIFLRDGVVECLLETPELFQGDLVTSVATGVASVFSQASGTKQCRSVVAAYATSWLTENARQTKNSALRAASAIALTKVLRGTSDDNDAGAMLAGETQEKGGTSVQARLDEETKLANLMKSVILEDKSPTPDRQSSILDAVEGLAYVSVEPSIKELLSNDSTFLSRLFALVPPPKKRQTGPVPVVNADDTSAGAPLEKGSVALLYGIAMIISNLVAFRPQLSEEEAQIDRLRNMAKQSSATGSKLEEPIKKKPENDLDSDQSVQKRCSRLLKAGVLVPIVAMASRVESEGVRRAVGKACLSLVHDKGDRGKFIQAGGAKALQGIIRASLESLKKAETSQPSKSSQPPRLELEALDLPAIQAFAKLLITSSPLLVLGPDASSSIDAITPLSHLLLNPSSTLLQKFEALMALTNIASLGPETSSRIAAKNAGILMKTETLLLDDNIMVRRAATELVCNLVSSDEVWERYTGEKMDAKTGKVTVQDLSINKLQILLALSDVEDLPTRMAASGALAMLTSSNNVCNSLLLKMENGVKRMFDVFIEMLVPSLPEDSPNDTPEPPDQQLVLRGVTCLRNILTNLDESTVTPSQLKGLIDQAEDVKLVDALVATLTSPRSAGSRDVLMACAQSLKWLTDHGVKLPQDIARGALQ